MLVCRFLSFSVPFSNNHSPPLFPRTHWSLAGGRSRCLAQGHLHVEERRHYWHLCSQSVYETVIRRYKRRCCSFLFNIYQARCCCCCLHVCRKYETLEEIFFFLRHPHWPRCDVHGGVEPVWQPNVKYFTLHIFFIHLKANISTRISIVILSVKLVIIFMFQSASQGPPPPFLLLLRLSSSSSIPPPHISPVLLLLPPCPPCGAARPWWTLPARWTRSPRCRRSNRWTSTTSTGLRSAPASGGCCRNRTALQVLQLTALGRCLGGALNN